MAYKKYKIPAIKVVSTFLLAMLIAGVLLFGATFMFFLKWPWDWQAYAVIIIYIVSSIVFLYLSLTKNYFILESKFICAHRMFKEMYYNFNEVVYIDKDYSEKHKVILFITNKGNTRYIPFDKNGELYKAMLSRCKNLISYEELRARYPFIKKIKPPK